MTTSRPTAPLGELYAARSVRMIEWGGVPVPAAFGDASDELTRLETSGAGLVDRTELGVVTVTGADRQPFLHRLTTADVRSFAAGAVHDALFVSGKGRILFHVRVWTRADELVLVHRAPGAAGILELLERYHFTEDVAFEDASPRWSVLHAIGARSADCVAACFGDVTSDDLAEARGSEPRDGVALLGGLPGGGVEILVDPGAALALWRELNDAGLAAVGREVWDAHRIERGIAEPLAELTDEYNPLEAGMRGAVSFRKGCYVGQEVVARLDTYDKLSRHLSVLRLEGDSAGASPRDRLVLDGRDVGILTSVSSLQRADGARAALGYVKRRDVPEAATFEIRSDAGPRPGRAVRERVV